MVTFLCNGEYFSIVFMCFIHLWKFNGVRFIDSLTGTWNLCLKLSEQLNLGKFTTLIISKSCYLVEMPLAGQPASSDISDILPFAREE